MINAAVSYRVSSLRSLARFKKGVFSESRRSGGKWGCSHVSTLQFDWLSSSFAPDWWKPGCQLKTVEASDDL